jgi:predicted RNA-binding Zn-ribbon protein involved in translation (DUF1610 family)
MARLQSLDLVPLHDVQAFQEALIEDENRTLEALLKEAPAFSMGTPLNAALLTRPVKSCRIRTVKLENIDPTQPLYPPPWGIKTQITLIPVEQTAETTEAHVPNGKPESAEDMVHVASGHPDTLDMGMAVARDVGLRYVYVERALGVSGRCTYCPNCGHEVVTRDIWVLRLNALRNGACPECGEAVPGKW